MKTIVTILVALAPAMAQIRPTNVSQPVPPSEAAAKIAPPASGGTVPMERAPVTLQDLKVLQTGFDNDLASYNFDNPIDIWGKTRGVYIADYGVIFTTELSPITTPPITPWHQKITDEEKERTHKLKLERLPAVHKLMTQMLQRSATHLALLPDNQQVVLIVKLVFLSYENVDGLPGQITMKGDKRSVLLGKFTVTEQE